MAVATLQSRVKTRKESDQTRSRMDCLVGSKEWKQHKEDGMYEWTKQNRKVRCLRSCLCARHKSARLRKEKVDDKVCRGKEVKARACSTPQRKVRQKRIVGTHTKYQACFYATAGSPESVRILSRSKKSIEEDSQKLGAKLAARSIGDVRWKKILTSSSKRWRNF